MEAVPQDVTERLEGSLESVSDGLLAGFLNAESLRPHAFTDPVADILMEGPVL